MSGQRCLIGRDGPTSTQNQRRAWQGYGRGCGSAAAKVLFSRLNITARATLASPPWCAAWAPFCSLPREMSEQKITELVLSPPEANECVILSRSTAEAKNLSATQPVRDSSSRSLS